MTRGMWLATSAGAAVAALAWLVVAIVAHEPGPRWAAIAIVTACTVGALVALLRAEDVL